MSNPTASELPVFNQLKGNRIQYRSDTEVFELECTEMVRGQADNKWALDIHGIGVAEKTPVANQFGGTYGQFWVTVNGQTYGAMLRCTGTYQGHRVKFCLSTLIPDVTYWG